MSVLKPCTGEYMISDTRSLRMRSSWYPRIVAEAFLESTKDGDIERAPDPVTMIDGDLPWFNSTGDDQMLYVLVRRASRTVVSTDPCTVVIHDAWSVDVGERPSAPRPTIVQDSFGGRLQLNKASTAPEDLVYGRFFLDCDASQTWVRVGVVADQEAMHFRFITSVQTPGVWIAPTETDPRYEAYARWARLQAFAAPVGSA